MFTKIAVAAASVVMLTGLAACDAGPYTPSAHRDAEASTGSMLSGTDTGVNANGNMNDPSIRSNFAGPAGGK